jgi:hypothetical protein
LAEPHTPLALALNSVADLNFRNCRNCRIRTDEDDDGMTLVFDIVKPRDDEAAEA